MFREKLDNALNDGEHLEKVINYIEYKYNQHKIMLTIKV